MNDQDPINDRDSSGWRDLILRIDAFAEVARADRQAQEKQRQVDQAINRSIKRSQWVIGGAAIASALVTAYYATVSTRQLTEMKGSLQVTRESLQVTKNTIQISNMSWVLLEDIEPVPSIEAGNPFPREITLHFRNFGGGPATDVFLDPSVDIGEAYPSRDLAQGQTVKVLGPNQPFILRMRLPGYVEKHREAFLKGKYSWGSPTQPGLSGSEFLRVCGQTIMHDIFGPARSIPFGRVLLPNGTWRVSACEEATGLLPVTPEIPWRKYLRNDKGDIP